MKVHFTQIQKHHHESNADAGSKEACSSFEVCPGPHLLQFTLDFKKMQTCMYLTQMDQVKRKLSALHTALQCWVLISLFFW